MEEAAVVWIDLNFAKLFHLAGKPEFEPKFFRDPRSMYDELAEALRSQSRILIIGPGVAKYNLYTRLREQFPIVAKKVAGCEAVDHPTDREITAYAMKFFGARTS